MKTGKIALLLMLVAMSFGLSACNALRSMNKCLPPEETPFGGKFYDKK